jgi:hypothetical protein
VDDVTKKAGSETYTEDNCDVQFDAVVTIAPRQDVANTDSDIPESMVTCICQVGLNKGNWQKGECSDAFILAVGHKEDGELPTLRGGKFSIVLPLVTNLTC